LNAGKDSTVDAHINMQVNVYFISQTPPSQTLGVISCAACLEKPLVLAYLELEAFSRTCDVKQGV
jgi:hypothetical protein